MVRSFAALADLVVERFFIASSIPYSSTAPGKHVHATDTHAAGGYLHRQDPRAGFTTKSSTGLEEHCGGEWRDGYCGVDGEERIHVSPTPSTTYHGRLLTDFASFSMPMNAPNPLTGYQHGGLLEEGRVQVTRTVLGKDGGLSTRCEGVGSGDEDEDELIDEDDTGEHPNLRMQWTWTDVKR